jgi:hypothetical protein
LDAFNEALLSERLQASIDNCLVQTGLGLEMFRPDALVPMFIPLSEGGKVEKYLHFPNFLYDLARDSLLHSNLWY